MASRAFNYSKWDNIELSDDDSDLHPNIDRDSWFRLKHRTRLEREAKEDQEVAKFSKLNQEDTSRLSILKARLERLANSSDESDTGEVEGFLGEINELETNIKNRNKYIYDIQEKRKWNIDNICKVKEEKTVVSKNESQSLRAEDFVPTGVTEKVVKGSNVETVSKNRTIAQRGDTTEEEVVQTERFGLLGPTPEKGERERFAVIAYNDYVLLHESVLEDYSEISDMDATKEYLHKHCDILLHEHAQSYMLLSCLEDEMNGKKERAKLVCRQSQILSHIHELGKSMNRDPRDVVIPFFKRIEEHQYFVAFSEAVKDFHERIKNRATEKRKEMDREEEENRKKATDVLESLPNELQEAFTSQSIEKLQQVLAAMDPAEAKMHMKRCIEVGLWVPKEGDDIE